MVDRQSKTTLHTQLIKIFKNIKYCHIN